MHIVALLATYNEQRFVAACIEHLIAQGVDVYLIDNDSTDQTVAIASAYRGRGVIGVEHLPRHGMYSWRRILERKAHLAATLDADWFMHTDADEIRLPPHSGRSLAQAIAAVDAQGYNAVNFLEFTFIPTQEAPDHDHGDFQRTMRSYYPFLPHFPHRLNAWKRQPHPVDLASSGGHQVAFPGLRMAPESFRMRHYLYLSVPHAILKYVRKTYDPAEVEAGWHRARASLRPELIRLPSRAKLRHYITDDQLDSSNPRTRHFLFDEDWARLQELSQA